ncbi:UNVERIFIED_CONTAM: hypothetical protein K2H54_060630 [Gekko kuhli]
MSFISRKQGLGPLLGRPLGSSGRRVCQTRLVAIASRTQQLLELHHHRLKPKTAELHCQLEHMATDCAALEAVLECLWAKRWSLQEEGQWHPTKLPPPPLARPGHLSCRVLEEEEESCTLVLNWDSRFLAVRRQILSQ